jgi:hypothetical protein
MNRLSPILEQSIASLCQRVEALASGSRTGVCIASPDGKFLRRAVFPKPPSTFKLVVKRFQWARRTSGIALRQWTATPAPKVSSLFLDAGAAE